MSGIPSRVATDTACATRWPDSMADRTSLGCMSTMTIPRHHARLPRRQSNFSIGMEAAMKKKAGTKSRKKKLKLRKKPLRDLPAKAKGANVKGGATLNPLNTLTSPALQRTFAPPYVPVAPVVRDI